MSNDPFSSRTTEYATSDLTYKSQSSLGWVYVLLGLLFGIFLLGILILCGGVWAYSNTGFSASSELPKPGTFEQDFESFNSDVRNFVASGSPIQASPQTAARTNDPEVERWLKQTLKSLNSTSSTLAVPFSETMFTQAIQNSRWATPFGFSQRLQLKFSLIEAFPDPDVCEYYTVLAVDREEDPATGAKLPFARANLLFYDGSSYAFSMRWFLCEEEGDWKLYDWERLEFGRRMSDEWANYFSNLDSGIEDNYDTAMSDLGEIIAQANGVSPTDPAHDQLVDRVRAIERRPILPADRAVRDLRICWTYETLGDYDEALRLLNQMQFPETEWGILAERADVLLVLDRYDEAITAANEFLKVAADHPNGHEIISLAYYYSDRDDLARPHLLKVLSTCPQNANALNRFVQIAKPTDLEFVLQTCLSRDLSAERLAAIVEYRFADDWQPIELFDQWQSVQPTFPSLPSAFWQLIQAVGAMNADDNVEATRLLQETIEQGPKVFADVASRQLRYYYERTKQYTALIELVGVEELIEETLTYYYNDDEAPEPDLLAALIVDQRTQSSPWIDLLRGIAWADTDSTESTAALERMLTAITTMPELFSKEANDSESQFVDSAKPLCENLLVARLISDGRAADALNRFGSTESTISFVTNYCTTNPHAAELPFVLDQLSLIESIEAKASADEIRAAVRMAENDFAAADQALLNAIRLRGENTDTENAYRETWRQQALAKQRVRNAIRSKAYSALSPLDPFLTNDMIQELAREGNEFCDVDAIIASNAMLASAEKASLTTKMIVAYHSVAARFLVDDAIATVTRIADDVESCRQEESPYQLYLYGQRFIELLILMGRINDAEKLAVLARKNNDWLDESDFKKMQAMICLRRSDADAAMVHLNTLSTADVRDWLAEELPKYLLNAHPLFAKMLYAKYSPLANRELGDFTVLLFDSSPIRPDQSQIQGWVAASLGNDVKIQQLERTDSIASYVFNVSAAGQFLITISDHKFLPFDGQYDAVADKLENSNHVLVIERLSRAISPLDASMVESPATDSSTTATDALAPAERLIWELATSAMTATSIAIYSEGTSSLWHCDATSNETLRWQGRLPIELAEATSFYLDYQDDKGMAKVVDARGLLAAFAAGKTNVRCLIGATAVQERLDAELIGLAPSKTLAKLRLKSSSQLDPALQSGTIILAHPDLIELAE